MEEIKFKNKNWNGWQYNNWDECWQNYSQKYGIRIDIEEFINGFCLVRFLGPKEFREQLDKLFQMMYTYFSFDDSIKARKTVDEFLIKIESLNYLL